jgi:hypothetical protein
MLSGGAFVTVFRRDFRFWVGLGCRARLEIMNGTGLPSIEALYEVRKGKIEFIDVPELGFLIIKGAEPLRVRHSMTPSRPCTQSATASTSR